MVDTEGGTNDPHVWAGGSATRLGRVALAGAGGREPLLSPAQVGRRLARAVMGNEEEEEEEAASFPIHREAQLPGGLTYLYLASGEATHSRLSTSNEDTGEFRLTFDKRERVSCVHCLARGHIPSSHLASLRGETINIVTIIEYGPKNPSKAFLDHCWDFWTTVLLTCLASSNSRDSSLSSMTASSSYERRWELIRIDPYRIGCFRCEKQF